MRKILVTGALGQIGSELVPALRQEYGTEAVIASSIRLKSESPLIDEGPFELLDCTVVEQLQDVVQRHDIGTVFHMAALLSAVAEEKPNLAWDLNMGSLYRVLETVRQHRCALFFPSSIGAFGPSTPPENTPQVTTQRPTTMYGVTKVAGELLCDYYVDRFDVDARGLRLPGLISYVAPPGGGTTDYAVDIFYHAIRNHRYTCFLKPDTRLDMMYMPDAVNAMITLMAADPSRLKHHNAFNVTAMNLTPEELADEIQKHIPDFTIDYDVDPVRQEIADSWPRSIDDREAREQWDWQPHYDLSRMTTDMLEKLGTKMKTMKK